MNSRTNTRTNEFKYVLDSSRKYIPIVVAFDHDAFQKYLIGL